MAEPGHFTWFDYVTTDAPRAQAFFHAVLGWTTQTHAIPTIGNYTTIVCGGRSIGGYAPPIAKAPGTPKDLDKHRSYWLSHLSVASAHDAAARAKTLGGTMVREPFTLGDHGKVAIALDPGKSIVGLVERPAGAELDHAPNTFVWNELYTTSTSSTVTFYKLLAGYTETKSAMPDGNNYHLMAQAGVPRCGIRKPHAGMPSGWFAWVRVTSVDDIAAKAHSLGATIHQPPADVGPSRMALVTDPQGCALGLITQR